MRRSTLILALPLLGLLPACTPNKGPDARGSDSVATDAALTDVTEDRDDARPFALIGEDETVRFTGTEPFWNGQVMGTALTYTTPEKMDGTDIAVTRFAGRGGVSWSGMYDGARFALAVTPGECSDGMSDRTYPFVATLEVAGEQRSGCAWTDRQPFDGSEAP